MEVISSSSSVMVISSSSVLVVSSSIVVVSSSFVVVVVFSLDVVVILVVVVDFRAMLVAEVAILCSVRFMLVDVVVEMLTLISKMLASLETTSTVGLRPWYWAPRRVSPATGVANLAISDATALTRGADAEVDAGAMRGVVKASRLYI